MSDNTLSRDSLPSKPLAPEPTPYEAIVNVWGFARALGRRTNHDVEARARDWDAVLGNVLYTPPKPKALPPSPRPREEQNLINFVDQYAADVKARAKQDSGSELD